MSNLSVEAKAKGKFRVQKRNVETGEIYFDSGEFDNTILNNYFSAPTESWSSCSLGTDSTVNVSDTSLTQISPFQSGATYSDTFSVDDNGLLTFTIRRNWTFAAGAVVGNMSCIGISAGSNYNGTSLKVKSLIKDVNGNPTTIPATASDQVIITHYLTITMNQTQDLGNIVIDGASYGVRFYCTNKSNTNGVLVPPWLPALSYNTTSQLMHLKASSSFTPPNIPNNSANSNITLSSPFVGSGIAVTHSSGAGLASASSSWTATMAANNNLAADAPIKAIGFGQPSSGGSCAFVYEFNPALPKNSSIAYTFTGKLTLSRE